MQTMLLMQVEKLWTTGVKLDIVIFGEFLSEWYTYPDLGSDAVLVWNFSARLSDVIWRENQW